ncbi:MULTISPECIES: hypothetical protein [Micrococcaceae]|uniref:hypothetical protein n=1 Tax=Micrococcaceae TaxID=1268 RepID=UPI0006F73F6B|nr:hypothetical protein [Arthrobacter sp. Leaf137]KQQ89722.1 hypothetical protein ASF64_17200 [Arthrobacter sp. Leaf137]MDQ1053834.1 hypothetical protein [Arthrobacter sp. SORGH_AS_0212]
MPDDDEVWGKAPFPGKGPEGGQPGPAWQINHHYDQLTYEMLTARFLAHDELLWQTPVLALTAQSFLMSISLDDGITNIAGATAAAMGAILILMSMHLLGRHRFLELIEKHKLKQLEEAMKIEPLSTHSWAWKYARAPKLGSTFKPTDYGLSSPRYPKIFSWPSYVIWQAGLSLFFIANIAICVFRVSQIG